MTGATGDLTPDQSEEPFIPAEQRAMLDPDPAPLPDDETERDAGGTTPGEDDGDDISDHEEHF
jgi:hypothetical protein